MSDHCLSGGSPFPFKKSTGPIRIALLHQRPDFSNSFMKFIVIVQDSL